MKKCFLVFAMQLLYASALYCQIEPGGVCNDRSGNIYSCGTFTNMIDLGDQNFLRADSSRFFVAKHDPKGKCLWASKFGADHDQTATAICADQSGNTYVTGSFKTATRFRNINVVSNSKKAYASPNFFIVKLNASGDPVWAKSSKNAGRDDGFAVAVDPSGNVFVAGTFDYSFDCDGKSVTSNGRTDVFVMKLNQSGSVLWVRNYGDKEDNGCNAIYYSDDKVYVASSIVTPQGYSGQLICLRASTGESSWTKEIGSKKGNIEAITADQDKAILVTGNIESTQRDDCRELFVAKYSSDGADVWTRKFTGGFPLGRAIVADQKGNIFVAGDFVDSLRMDKVNTGGYPVEDLFLARLASNGAVMSIVSGGNSKADRGMHLHMFDNKVVLAGAFTDGLTFEKLGVKGSAGSMFAASFELAKNKCTDLKLLASEEVNGVDVKFTDIYGKLLTGPGQNKSFLTDHPLHLEDHQGQILRRTMTDERGDFSFKNIDGNASMNIVIERTDKVQETDEIYLATQTGIIIDKIVMKDKKFKYPVIDAVINQMVEMKEEDVELKFKDFGGNGGKEFMITERVSYEAGSWSIPAESIPYMNKIVKHMKLYPRVRVEVNSYTDALGDSDFNKKLSHARADEVKEFLIQKKISPNRITVLGHGEEKILNRCADSINCAESEHAYNRRTEFRFYMGPGL